MDNKDEIKRLERQIYSCESKINDLKRNIKRTNEDLKECIKRLSFLQSGGQDVLPMGTKLLFKDEDNVELIIAVVMNPKGNYDALLLTNYSYQFELMKEYFIFDYNCIYTNTLVEQLESDYDFTFIKVIEE